MPSKSEMIRINERIERSGGVINERDPNFSTVRLRLPGGSITPEQITTIGKITRRYGVSSLHITTRQTIEIAHVERSRIPSLLLAMEKIEIGLGAEHEEVVNITACPGTERCRLANIATGNLRENLDRAHFGKGMPIRVRIAVSACPNGCTSERLSEIGITGLRMPIRNEGKCTGCGTCANTCKETAIVTVNGRLTLDTEKCMECGMCIDSCPFQIIQGLGPYYMITVGGRRGRHPQLGRELIRVSSAEKAVEIVNRVVDWIRRNAYSGKNLTDQMDTMDFSQLQTKIIKEFGEPVADSTG